jgi:hypothetical protein
VSGAAWSAPRRSPSRGATSRLITTGKRCPQRLPAGARAAVFATAGLEARFVNEPQKRIWANFQHGTTNYCSISWYRLPEREALAQYSQPFHEDLPHTILIAPGMGRVKRTPRCLAAGRSDADAGCD